MFKEGDILIGNDINTYAYTSKGVYVEVINASSTLLDVVIISGRFAGELFYNVEPKYFDFAYGPSGKTPTLDLMDVITS